MIHLLVAVLLLAGCTVINVHPGGNTGYPVTIQTSNSTDVLGSQNVAKDDTESAGDVQDGDGSSTQGAQSNPQATVTLPTGITQ